MTTALILATNQGVVVLGGKPEGDWNIDGRGLVWGSEQWEVSRLALVPSDPRKVLAGTRGDGVWLSEDQGKTWHKPSRGNRGPGKVRSITIDPHDTYRLYAGCEPIDIFVSEDLGESWVRLDSVRDGAAVDKVDYPSPRIEPHIRDIAISPSDPNTLYASVQVGHMLKSADRGRSWKLLHEGLDADVHVIAVHPQRPNQIVVTTGGGESRRGVAAGRALYQSLDGGETWKPIAMNFAQTFSEPLAVHPADADILYCPLAKGPPTLRKGSDGASGVLVRSHDGGTTWEQVDKGLDGMAKFFATAIAFDEDEPNTLYAAFGDGSLFSSQDSGDSWRNLGVRVEDVNDMKVLRK